MTTNSSLREEMGLCAMMDGECFAEYQLHYRGSMTYEELVHQWNVAMTELGFEDEAEAAHIAGYYLKRASRILKNLDKRGLSDKIVAMLADMSENDMRQLKAALGV